LLNDFSTAAGSILSPPGADRQRHGATLELQEQTSSTAGTLGQLHQPTGDRGPTSGSNHPSRISPAGKSYKDRNWPWDRQQQPRLTLNTEYASN